MTRRPDPLAGIEPLDLPTDRHAIPRLHEYLRACVLDGRLAPGTAVSQVALADRLGVSRTPLREVLRMLQEEGLLESTPNQRMRVASLDPVVLDSVYASRILLETLALSMTWESLGRSAIADARRLLKAMRAAARSGDLVAWFGAHHSYHRLLTRGVDESLARQIAMLEDRSTRYIRTVQSREPSGWQKHGDAEHAAILTALADDDRDAALTGLANHLAHTAVRVLEDCQSTYVPVAVPHAVALAAR